MPADAVEQSHTRCILPAAVDGGLFAVGNCPVAGKAPEVVDAHQVEQDQARADPVTPPAEIIVDHRLPVEERIAPKLTGLAEIIGRYTTYCDGFFLFVELEQSGVGPGIGTVHRYIDRNISYN